MKEWTGIEIERAHQGLEQASATILGRMIFEFSRLDVSLGLILAWAHEGSQLEKLTAKVSDFSFNKKLEFLAELVQTKYENNLEAKRAHARWSEDAHVVRASRNDLIHGRWGVDPISNQVVNVVGLPTGEQVEQRYTISELKVVLVRMQQLEQQLSVLRVQWPV